MSESILSNIVGLSCLFLALCLCIFLFWFSAKQDKLKKEKVDEFFELLDDEERMLIYKYNDAKRVYTYEVFKRRKKNEKLYKKN